MKAGRLQAGDLNPRGVTLDAAQQPSVNPGRSRNARFKGKPPQEVGFVA
jgi:hypothetical protein